MTDEILIRKVADIGFMASSAGLPKHAFAIFNAIEKARPDSTLPYLGFALEFMNKKMNQEALEILEKQALPKAPDDPSIKAFIGMVLMLEGRNKESEDYLTAALNTDEPEVKVMAGELLNNIHKG
ncbi:MAG: tetratricopeptide repeat protein [Endozoicomonas sp.]